MMMRKRNTGQRVRSQVFAPMLVKFESLPARQLVVTQQPRACFSSLFIQQVVGERAPKVESIFGHVIGSYRASSFYLSKSRK